MPVLGSNQPTVQVSVPVPQPVPQRPRPQPVPRGGVTPALAPVPPGMGPQQAQPKPLPTAVILPFLPEEKRQMHRLPRRVVRYRETPSKASPRVVDPVANPAQPKGKWTPLYPEFAVSPEQGISENPREGGESWESAPEPSHVKGWKLQGGGFVRKFYGPAVGREGTAEVLHVKFKGKKNNGRESEYEYYFDGAEGEEWLDKLRGTSAPGKVVWQMIRAEVPYKRVYQRQRMARAGQPVQFAAGKHGTPAFNPAPHPQADSGAVARRDTDPLWMDHRGLPLTEEGNLSRGIASWTPALDRQIEYHQLQPREIDPPEGILKWADASHRHRTNSDDADLLLAKNFDHRTRDRWWRLQISVLPIPTIAGALSFRHPDNSPRYEALWAFHGGRHGPRPWYYTVHPLQTLEGYAAPHDPYRLLAASVLSGNRHSLPPLVDLLKRRDNPAGWYPGWASLAKAMEERTGDLPVQEVFRRAAAIAHASARHSDDPKGHYELGKGAAAEADPLHGRGDFTGFAALSDHMEENGLPSYAQLLRAELANVIPQFRHQTKGQRRLARRVVRVDGLKRYSLGERQAFEKAIDAQPEDATTHLVYADWLEDHGEPDEAAFRRAMGKVVPRMIIEPEHRYPFAFEAHQIPETVQGGRFVPDPQDWRTGMLRWPEYRYMENRFRSMFVANPRRYSLDSERLTLMLKNLRNHRANMAAYATRQRALPPEQMAGKIVSHLQAVGQANRRQLQQKFRLNAPALDAAVQHGLRTGLFTSETRPGNPKGGGPTATWYRLPR